MVSTNDFRQKIRSRLELASAERRLDLTIECGELYRSIGSLPASSRGMIFCCNAMRAEMIIQDEVIFDDEKNSLLKVRYKLPRKIFPLISVVEAEACVNVRRPND